MFSNFSDSSNFIIINNIPRVIDNGTTYLCKFKNGLSLDSIIEKEIFTPIVDSVISNENNTILFNESKFYNDEYANDEYYNLHDKLDATIKSKYHKSMRSQKYNPKKSKKILFGNNFKLFSNEELFQTNVTGEEKEYMYDYDYYYHLISDSDSNDDYDLYNDADFDADCYRHSRD